MVDSVDGIKIRVIIDERQVDAEFEKVSDGAKDAEKKTGKSFSEMSKKFIGFGKVVAKWAAASTAAIAATGAAMTLFGAKTSRELNLAADRLGITSERLRDLQNVAQNFITDGERLNDALKDLSERIADAAIAGGAYEEFLNQIGLKSQDLLKIPVDQQFLKVADGIKALNTEAQQNLVAVNLMGDAGFEMLGVLKQGSAAIEDQIADWRALRGEISELDFKRAGELANAIGVIKTILADVSVVFASEFAPAIAFFVDKIKTMVIELGGAEGIARGIGEFIEKGMKLAADAIQKVIVTWNRFKVAIGQLSVVIFRLTDDFVKGILFIRNKVTTFKDLFVNRFEQLAKAGKIITEKIKIAFIKMSQKIILSISDAMVEVGDLMRKAGIKGAGALIGSARKVRAEWSETHRGLDADLKSEVADMEVLRSKAEKLTKEFKSLNIDNLDTGAAGENLQKARDLLADYKKDLEAAMDLGGAPGVSFGDFVLSQFKLFKEGLDKKLETQIEHDEMMNEHRAQQVAMQREFSEQEQAIIDEKVTAIHRTEQESQLAIRALWDSGLRGRFKIASDILGQISVMMESHSRTQFEIGKKAAIAQATIDTIQGAQAAFTGYQALPQPYGTIAGAAAAAAAIAGGIIRVNKIRSTQFGGGGGVGAGSGGAGGGGSASASGGVGGSVSPKAEPQNVQNFDITVAGNNISRDSVISLITEINAATDDNVKLNARGE